MRMLVLALPFALGCSRGAPDVDCASVGNGVRKFWTEKARTAETPEDRAEAEAMGKRSAERLERHCKADGWSADFIICARAAVQPEEAGCMKYLSREQSGKLMMDPVDQTPQTPGGLNVGG
ncbi:MAG TPA: hypothetical protein VFQ53_09515 [Kofleriaceae bacterium]|nr:hypothetical protein [Kofleriaceae bacterium]